MRFNYLYKCEECDTVKAWKENYGPTRMAFCKSCNSLAFHSYLYIAEWPYSENRSGGIRTICAIEREENDNPGRSKEKS